MRVQDELCTVANQLERTVTAPNSGDYELSGVHQARRRVNADVPSNPEMPVIALLRLAIVGSRLPFSLLRRVWRAVNIDYLALLASLIYD